MGEPLASNTVISDNAVDFLRDERFEYDTELRPETCAVPAYSQSVTEPTCQSYGYTAYTCAGCGYTYWDDYTLHADHASSQWILMEAPTEEREGMSVGNCDTCGLELRRSEAKLSPQDPVAETESPQEESLPATETTPGRLSILAAIPLLLVVIGILVLKRKKV